MNNRTIKRQNVTFITNGQGFVELMNSSEVQQLVGELAQSRANALASGKKTYRTEVVKGRNRCHAYVAADSYEARLSNLQNNDLLKALK